MKYNLHNNNFLLFIHSNYTPMATGFLVTISTFNSDEKFEFEFDNKPSLEDIEKEIKSEIKNEDQLIDVKEKGIAYIERFTDDEFSDPEIIQLSYITL